MAIARLLREQSIGETRWVALDTDGYPAALRLDRDTDAVRRACLGEQLEVRVRKLDPGAGGVFVDLGRKGEAFLRLGQKQALTEGASLTVEVVAEARQGKLPRVRQAQGVSRGGWRKQLTGGATAPVEDRLPGDAEVQAAFDEALKPRVTLAGGGTLQITRTEALVAADIDTSGRAARGGRAALSRAVNLAAAEALARQAHLRGLGGLMVLDCLAPLDSATGRQLRTAFLNAWRAISARQVKALTPSVFGLMEVSADWQVTPLADRFAETAESIALAGLRKLESAARQDRMQRLTLKLPRAALDWLANSGLDVQTRLADKYGARLTICAGGGDDPQVSETT
jgi:Ribonuclease G/E